MQTLLKRNGTLTGPVQTWKITVCTSKQSTHWVRLKNKDRRAFQKCFKGDITIVRPTNLQKLLSISDVCWSTGYSFSQKLQICRQWTTSLCAFLKFVDCSAFSLFSAADWGISEKIDSKSLDWPQTSAVEGLLDTGTSEILCEALPNGLSGVSVRVLLGVVFIGECVTGFTGIRGEHFSGVLFLLVEEFGEASDEGFGVSSTITEAHLETSLSSSCSMIWISSLYWMTRISPVSSLFTRSKLIGKDWLVPSPPLTIHRFSKNFLPLLVVSLTDWLEETTGFSSSGSSKTSKLGGVLEMVLTLWSILYCSTTKRLFPFFSSSFWLLLLMASYRFLTFGLTLQLAFFGGPEKRTLCSVSSRKWVRTHRTTNFKRKLRESKAGKEKLQPKILFEMRQRETAVCT